MAERMRFGWGFDAHRFGGDGPIVLCGVEVDAARGIEATSDGDLAAHAVIDALFGAAAMGDLGTHFASDHPSMQGANSMHLVERAVGLLAEVGYRPGNVDVTIVSQSVRIAPHREAMRSTLAAALGIDTADVSVKATSTDGMGSIGADEGIAAAAVVTVVSSP